MYQALHPTFPSEFKGHKIIARKGGGGGGGEPGNEASIYGILYMYITKYSCVFLKLGESIYVAMDLIPILLGSLPLAHNAQHSLVSIIGRAGASPPSRTAAIIFHIYI